MRKTTLIMLAIVTLSSCNALKNTVEASSDLSKLGGSWELNYISGPRIAFNGLYPGKKPQMIFNLADKRISGNSSCNSFSGKLQADDTSINFNEPLIVTKMACPGEGEAVFFEMLKKVNKYAITGDTTLNFMMGDIAIMRFKKIQ
ncbi:META domain-containing protein [Pedobacter sp. MC2016-15]|uniref:META domain-containing protein n=1 Tax=Pedobacter sp. MC2016-15 TaxID=2994473 RepID=UPI002247448D|nr:META domain-containing protein [Pedobacter sp. MC2016-15]MCX2481251.1 META domain-containing protein [Pedobacter sp. MC2016-15]